MEELNSKINKLGNQIAELKTWKDSLEMAHTIPLNVDRAFRKRLESLGDLKNSSKLAASENIVIDESGGLVKSALKQPDKWVQTVIAGTTIYLPAYS